MSGICLAKFLPTNQLITQPPTYRRASLLVYPRTVCDTPRQALVDTPLPLPYYGLLPFLEYVLYPPLYIAGPIITFNSFTAQRKMREAGNCRIPQRARPLMTSVQVRWPPTIGPL